MLNRLVRSLSALAVGTGLALTASTFSSSVAGAGSGMTPLTCEPGFYQVISGQLNILNPVTGAYTPVGSTYPGQYNAMGYNVADNFFYAISQSGATSKLLKIGSDGAVDNLGTPTGVTIPSSGTVFNAGDMDDSGNLLVNMTSGRLLAIDVATNTASEIRLTKNGSPTTVGAADLSWINGSLYGVWATTLYRIDATTGRVTTQSLAGYSVADEGSTFGASWSDVNDELYVSSNLTGHIFKISGYTGSSPSASLVLNGAPTSSNDGASCKIASSPDLNPTAADDAYGAQANQTLTVDASTGVLSNDTGTGLTASVVTGPANGTLTLNPDGSFTYTPNNGFSGVDTFTYTGTDADGRTTNTATVTITVGSGALHAVSYDVNGGNGDTPTQGALGQGTAFTVGSGEHLDKPGHTFGGWSDGTSIYQAGDTYTMGGSDVQFTAIWTPNATVHLTYDSQGGSSVGQSSGPDGSTVSVASGPTRPGYVFAGWNTEPTGLGTKYDPSRPYILDGNSTLYAQWTPASGSPFACTGLVFQVRNGQLVTLDLATGATSNVGNASMPWMNAMGANPLDGYVYGIRRTAKKVNVVRVASDGSITSIGSLVGVNPAGLRWTAGDMDGFGHLLVPTTPTTLLSINVTTLETATIHITSPWGIPMALKGDDLVYSNGIAYSLHGVNLYAVDVATGVETISKVAGLKNTKDVFGAGFVDGSGTLHFARNVDGAVFSITATGGGYSATKVPSSAMVKVTDGASCPTPS